MLPDDVVAELHRLEWADPSRLKERLLGNRRLPIERALKPPTGQQALGNLAHFHDYRAQWRKWPWPEQVQWSTKQYRLLGELDVPVSLRIESVQDLINVLGPTAITRSNAWTERIGLLLPLSNALYPALISCIFELEKLSVQQTQLLACVLPQLLPGLGADQYLRALPVRGVDTKFIEENRAVITRLLDALHDQEVSLSGGLESWLGCRSTPSNWLYLKPLCPQTRQRLAGLEILRLPLEQLLTYSLPADNILVVENLQAGYGLPELPNTIAVLGTGSNTSWMQAKWLTSKRIGYWGDLDTWGFKLLADARRHQPHVQSLLMDETTLLEHLDRGAVEDVPAVLPQQGLSEQEAAVFEALHSNTYHISRLEQERLPQNVVIAALQYWAAGEDSFPAGSRSHVE